jgi:hypothetical protein
MDGTVLLIDCCLTVWSNIPASTRL